MVASKKLILCEGGEDKAFLNIFIKEYLSRMASEFEVQTLNNKSNFFKSESYNLIMQKINTGQYDKVLFFFDSDFKENDLTYGGFENSKNEIEKMIGSLGVGSISKYYICCDPSTKNGNLEHLLLASADKNKRECLEKLLKCVGELNANSNKKIILTAYKEIFKDSPYNLDHDAFADLKDKMNWLFG
ncbi:MAG: hypothetical protein WCR69_09235 [Sulfuricurvum sp.]